MAATEYELLNNTYKNIMASASWPQIGQYIDFRDRDNTWHVGLIVARTSSEIKVRSEGWAAKYDEVISLSDQPTLPRNSRIQPFRSLLRGYTGIQKIAGVRDHWKFTNEDHEVRIKKAEEFISNLHRKTSEEVTQFLRGEHYFYIDFLMTNTYQQTAELHRVYAYFRKHIAIANSYISFMIKKRGMIWMQLYAATVCDQLLQWQKNYAHCYYQIFEALYTIAGLFQRLSCFMKNNEKLIRTIVGVCETHENYVAEEYNSLGLVDSAKALIKQVYEWVSSSQPPKLLFSFVFSLFQLFLSIEKSIQLQQDSSAIPILLDQLFKIITIKFQQLSPEDMKYNEIDREIQFLLFHIKNVYTKYNKRAKTIEWLETTKIKISLILIRCDKLERKLRGINRLKDYCQLSMREEEHWSITRERWRQMLTEGCCFQLLFLHNEHVQIFRKSIELSMTLYRQRVIGVEQVEYIWTHSVHKHPMLLKILQQFWIQICFCTPLPDMLRFIDITHPSITSPNPSNQQLEFHFEFTLALVKHLATLKSKSTGNLKQFEGRVYTLMSHAYQQLTESLERQNIDSLIKIFSKAVLKYPDPHKLILQLYHNLTSEECFGITLHILNEIYFHSDHKNIFIPQNFFNIFLTCLKRNHIDLQEVTLIIKLANQILLASAQTPNPYHLKNEQFRDLWLFFMTACDQYRQIFYDWILTRKKQDYIEPYNVINPAFHIELRHYIFDHILCDQTLLPCERITPKQLDIVIEFLIFKNLNQGRIQKRNHFTNYRTFFRLKAAEVAGQNLLWQIFGKSSQNEIVSTINKYLSYFYFFYTTHVTFKIKKERISRLMTKMISNIEQGYQNHNFILIKHTLALLTKIIDLIKDKRYDYSHHQNSTKIKITIARGTNVYQFEINYEDTIGAVTNKLKDHFKLAPHRFKLISCKNDELSFQSRDIPMCCFTERVFRIQECSEEENIPAFIQSFFTPQFQELLLKMLEGKELTSDSFTILEKLDLKMDKKVILFKLNEILERHLSQKTTLIKQLVYYYLLQVKIITKLSEEEGGIEAYINGPEFKNILSVLSYRIQNTIQIQLCLRLTNFLMSLATSKIEIPAVLQLPNKCVNLMTEITSFMLNNSKAAPYIRQYLAETFQFSFQIIEAMVKQNDLLQFLVSHTHFAQLVQTVLLNVQLNEIRPILADKINKYLPLTNAESPQGAMTQKKLASLLINQIYWKIKRTINSKEAVNNNHKGVLQFYNILSKLIIKMSPDVFQQCILFTKQNQISFFQTIIKFLDNLKHYKRLTNYLTSILCGQYYILIAIYQCRPQLVDEKIVSFVLSDSLGLSSNADNRYLCEQSQSVTAAFELMQQILVRNTSPNIIRFIITSLLPSHNILLWRMSGEWAVSHKIETKQKYRGLINPGCICYLNSLIQQLYMIEQFRLNVMAVTNWKDKQLQYYNKTNLQQSYEYEGDLAIINGLKELFFNLYYSQQNSISPLGFTKTFRTSDKKPLIKINQQMDIDQFESILFDKLERGMSTLCQHNFIKDLFGGVYAHQIISKECAHTSQREQEFISISLQVKKSLQQSFQALVKIEMLDGENKYYCQKCDRKVRAEKMQTLKKLPPYLILCLKRFEFNYQIDAKIKINDYCQFTQELKLKGYSQQQTNNKTKTVDIDEGEGNKTQGELPDDYFNYKLRGVVVHTGSADSGHYYSFIQDSQGLWFQFNDEDVVPFDLSKLPQQAFGSRDNYEQCKIRNAYLLIYQKKVHSHYNFREKQLQIMSRQQNRLLVQRIRETNVQIHKFQLLFLPEYEQFVQRVGINVEQLSSKHNLEKEWYEFYLSFYFLIRFRKEYVHELIEFSKNVEKTLLTRPLFCDMFLNLFSSCLFVQEFFIYNPNRQKCKILCSLLHTALLKHYQTLRSQSNYECDQLLNSVLMCLKIIFVNYAPIYELMITLRKFIDYLVKSGNSSFVVFIINKYNFEVVCFDHLFSIAQLKKTKDEYQHLLSQNEQKVQISFISGLRYEGKKLYPAYSSQCWKLLSILFRLTNILLERENILMKDQKIYKEAYLSKSLSSLYTYKNIFDNFQNQINSIALGKLVVVIYDCSNYKGAYAMFLVFRELKLAFRLIQTAEKALKDYQFNKFRSFLLALYFFMSDSRTTEQEMQKIVNCLEKSFKANDKYFLQADLIIQWISKFAEQSELFAQTLLQKRQFIDSMIQWINKQCLPVPETLKKHVKFIQIRRTYQTMDYLTAEPRDYSQNFLRIKSQFESIINFKHKTQKRRPNIDENFVVATSIEYFDLVSSKWRKGKISENNFGSLSIIKEGKNEIKFYLWEDSERLRMAQQQEEEPSESENSDISYSESQKSIRSESDIPDC